MEKIKNGNNNIGAHRFQMCCVNTCTRFRFRCFRFPYVYWDWKLMCAFRFVFSLLFISRFYFNAMLALRLHFLILLFFLSLCVSSTNTGVRKQKKKIRTLYTIICEES